MIQEKLRVHKLKPEHNKAGIKINYFQLGTRTLETIERVSVTLTRHGQLIWRDGKPAYWKDARAVTVSELIEFADHEVEKLKGAGLCRKSQ